MTGMLKKKRSLREEESTTTPKTQRFAIGKYLFCLINFFCWYSWVIVPGTAILSRGALGIAYCLTLIYLFMGIAIVSDIFML